MTVQPSHLLSCLADILLESGIIALDRLQLLVESLDLVCFQLTLSRLLLKFPFNIALLILKCLHCLPLFLNVTLRLKTALNTSLDFKAVFFELSQLLHQRVFVLHQTSVAC